MKNVLAVLVLLLLSACGFSRPTVATHSFLLQPQRLAPPAAAPVPVRLGRIEVAPPFARQGLVYRRGEQDYETDFYNEFAVDPATMIAAACREWLHQGGHLAVPGAAGREPLRLDAEVTALYVDFRAAPTAVVALRWRLRRAGEGGLVAEFAADERVPLAERSPAGAAAALQTALGRALGRIEAILP